MAWMETGFDVNQEMRSWISPSLIEANHILSLSQQELQQAIAIEMDANPALEIEDRQTCPTCGGVLDGTYCSTCLTNQQPTSTEERIDTLDDYNEQNASGNLLREEDPDFDPMTLIATGVSIPEQILSDSHSLLDESEYGIAEYIVESFDDRGFLTVTLEEIASALNVSIEAVQSVLDVIQDVSPVGVGSRTLGECLRLQTMFLEQSGTEVPVLVKTVINEYLNDFGSHKFGHIARNIGVSVEEVEDVRDFIRLHLNPFPMQSAFAKSWRSPTEDRYVAPDVIIMLDTDVLKVEIVDTKYLHLRMNPMYEELANQFGKKKTAPTEEAASELAESAAHADDSEKTHVRQYTNRARIFMTNVQQRRDTLLRISLCIIELQDAFLRGSIRDLRPLTRAIVAQQVGVHESTVSRATANKFVMLPTRKVIPFSDFFTASLSTKDIIKEMIEQRGRKGDVLTDKKICELLLQQGVRIARRTVAKYRAELGILPSTIR
ncbi:MAG: RNA polymerase factor sigma-54 [Thermomicrobiales bacterium]